MFFSELGSMNGECFAPFLSNPYVNMGMYIAYYWTTLVAMLILYKVNPPPFTRIPTHMHSKVICFWEDRHFSCFFS